MTILDLKNCPMHRANDMASVSGEKAVGRPIEWHTQVRARVHINLDDLSLTHGEQAHEST
jgi:hypothetical protein